MLTYKYYKYIPYDADILAQITENCRNYIKSGKDLTKVTTHWPIRPLPATSKFWNDLY